MHRLPSRVSLHSQVLELIKDEVARGTWTEWLPGERGLVQRFRVSRNTLRTALKTLEAEGWIRSQHGVGYRLLSTKCRNQSPQPNSIGLIVPKPLDVRLPSSTFWINELRGALFNLNIDLDIHVGANFFSKRCASALPALVSRHRHQCWILLLSSEDMQKWFYASRTPCVLAGSCYPGINLPSVDVDRRSQCRHAAGAMIAHGHKRIAFLHGSRGLAGDEDSEAGFLEAARTSSVPGVTAEFIAYTSEVGDIQRNVKKLLSREDRPTALLVANSHHYLAVISTIWNMRLEIPGDVSVISRDDELFLTYVIPEPARYTLSAQSFSDKIISLVRQTIAKENAAHQHLKLIPEFYKGASLAMRK